MSELTITVVHAPACHFCDDAGAALAELAHDHPLRVELVEADSTQGLSPVAAHRAGMFPLVLVDRALFSAGRLPRGKFRKLLAERYPGAGMGGRC